MKKALKIIMVVLILFGIMFTISNFISFDLHAGGQLGIWNSTVDECEGYPIACRGGRG